MSDPFAQQFDEQVKEWAVAASQGWDFPEPSEDFFRKACGKK
jgi:hypothetical protein